MCVTLCCYFLCWGEGDVCGAGSRDLMFVNGRARAVQVSVARP